VTPPSPAFLEELRERARRAGWDYDYVEVRAFVEALYREAGLDVPDLEPYGICPACDRVTPDCVCSAANSS
jgi:hypothetical protein